MRIVVIALLLATCPPLFAEAQDSTTESAAPRAQLSGYIQYDYLAPIGEEAAEPADTFRFRRVRLQGTGMLNENIGWTVSVEATASPILRDAFVTLKYLPAATVRVGQLVLPYGQEQYVFSSNTMAFTERVTVEIIASRDAGVMVSNERPFFGWLSYAAALTNGTRQNIADNNSAKDGMVRLTATPERVKGLSVGISAMKGEQPSGMRTRSGADVSFERRAFHVAAELIREHAGDGTRRRAGYVFGAVRWYPASPRTGFHHSEFGVRLARTEHLVRPINQWDFSANYYVHQNMRFMFSILRHVAREPGTPRATFHARANIRF